MKALSLWQPWASLIAIGAKRYETRSWGTRYRGPLLICAAKTWNADCKFARRHIPEIAKALRDVQLPFGVAVCIVDLVGCFGMDEFLPVEIQLDIEGQRPFGDFSPGRFAWKLENVRKVPPFEVKGKQGLFEVPLMPGEIS